MPVKARQSTLNPLNGATDPPGPQVVVRHGPPGPLLQLFRIRHIQQTHATVEIPGLPEELSGLRITHLSDLHLRTCWHPAFDDMLQQVRDARPDLILLTGDLVDDKRNHRPALPLVRRLLESLHATLGVYCILGNHDGDLLAAHLPNWPGMLLNGRGVHIPIGKRRLELVGLPGPYREDLHDCFLRRLGPRQADTPRIIMSHFPDHLPRLTPLAPDIIFCGHTHGGQVCLPGGFALMRHDKLPRRYCKGIHRIDNTWLVVSRGVGFSGLPIRAFCPPQVMHLKLLVAKSPQVPAH